MNRMLLALSMVLSGSSHCVALAESADRPNVLFIAVDDLNDWAGPLGGSPTPIETPNLDRLARRGVNFTRAYCAAPACNPSRTALLTGLRPSTTGVYHNRDPWRSMLPDVVTLPQAFRRAGYRVEGGGKIFHGRFNDPGSWDDYFAQRADPVPGSRPVNGIPRTSHFDWGPVSVDDDAMSDHKVVSWAIDFLGSGHEEPFFLAVGLYRPHLPWYVPEKYFEEFPLEGITLPEVPEDDLEDVPPPGLAFAKPQGDHARVLEAGEWKAAVRGYLASIAFADFQLGRLLDAFDASGYSQNTIVVLWGDHGWHLGEKEHWRKFALWEEATRVPLIVVAPGKASAQRCERTVNLLDLYPTLLELCELPVGDHLEGTSLVPLLGDPSADRSEPSLTTHGRGNHAVRDERWRYIRYADGSEELYDHENDPAEWNNLADRSGLSDVKSRLGEWAPKEEKAERGRSETFKKSKRAVKGAK